MRLRLRVSLSIGDAIAATAFGSQDPSSRREGLRSSRRRASQGALHSDFVKGELRRRGEARVDASSESGYRDERARRRSRLSSISDDSGAWLSAGASPKALEASSSQEERRRRSDDAQARGVYL